MEKNLYLARASRFVEADPARGRPESTTEYSPHYLVVDRNPVLAANKFLTYLRDNTVHRGWEISEVKELVEGLDVPLEKRLEILGEHFTILE